MLIKVHNEVSPTNITQVYSIYPNDYNKSPASASWQQLTAGLEAHRLSELFIDMLQSARTGPQLDQSYPHVANNNQIRS